MGAQEMESKVLERDEVEISTLSGKDLDWIVSIDREHTGQNRREFYHVKLQQAQSDTGLRISLGARVEGEPAGFLLGRLYYGEFGIPEPVAILDSIGVARDFANRGVGRALMRQLKMHLRALHIETVQTQVEWDQEELLHFFRRAGFRPAARLCLEAPVERMPDQ